MSTTSLKRTILPIMVCYRCGVLMVNAALLSTYTCSKCFLGTQLELSRTTKSLRYSVEHIPSRASNMTAEFPALERPLLQQLFRIICGKFSKAACNQNWKLYFSWNIFSLDSVDEVDCLITNILFTKLKFLVSCIWPNWKMIQLN